MKKWISLFVSLPLLLSISAANQKIPLAKAIQEGVEQNLEYTNKLLDEKNARLLQKQKAAQKLFNLNLQASYLYKSETMSIEIPSIQLPGDLFFPGRQIEAGLHHNYDLNLSLSQPLYTGGILSGSLKLEEVKEAVEANQSILKKNQIIDLIKSSFFRYLILIQRRNSLFTLRQKLELHHQKLENFFEEGLIDKTPLLETLSQIKELNLNLKDIDRAIDKEQIHFKRLCGYLPEEIDPDYREECPEKEKALSYFQDFHPVLRTIDQRIKMLEISKKIAAGEYLPQVHAFLQLHYGKPGLDFFKKEWMLYAQGGISVNLSVFDWNNLDTEKKILDNQILKLHNQRKSYIQKVTEKLNSLYNTLHSLESKLSEVEALIGYAQEETELKKELFREKEIPHLDYLTSLMSVQKFKIQKQEISLQIEQIEVKINTLIAQRR